MIEAVAWGVAAASSLLIGALIAVVWDAPKRVLATVIAFGAGVLVSAVSFELAFEAIDIGGGDAFASGIAAGAVTFFLGSRLLHHIVTGSSARAQHAGAGVSAAATDEGDASREIVLGAVLDGVPESIAIGLGVAAGTVSGGAGGIAMVAAVFLSNLPEAMGSTAGLRRSGTSVAGVLGMWGSVVVLAGICAALGFLAADQVGVNIQAGMQAFAAGAILVMITDTMIPDAVAGEGDQAGLFVALGFAVSALVSAV